MFLKYCPCFLPNNQWSSCQIHLFIFRFYLLFCNWPCWPFFFLQLSDSWFSSPWLLVILLLCLHCCFLGSYQTPLVSLVSRHWHQPHTTHCSSPSRQSYSCWATSTILVSWSHPGSVDGPPSSPPVLRG